MIILLGCAVVVGIKYRRQSPSDHVNQKTMPTEPSSSSSGEQHQQQQHRGSRFRLSTSTRFIEVPNADIEHDTEFILNSVQHAQNHSNRSSNSHTTVSSPAFFGDSPHKSKITNTMTPRAFSSSHAITTTTPMHIPKRPSDRRYLRHQFYSPLLQDWMDEYVDEAGTPYYVSGSHVGYRGGDINH